MDQKWSTEVEDMQFAQTVIEQYVAKSKTQSCEIFELYVDTKAKRMGFCLAKWVVVLAHHFCDQYGPDQGDFVVRQVIAKYMVRGNVLH